jgi:hypothetical protein
METLILKGVKILSAFIEMLKQHATNGLKDIKDDDMFDILITISTQLYNQLIVNGRRRALQHLFQSVLLVTEFDFVLFTKSLVNDKVL